MNIREEHMASSSAAQWSRYSKTFFETFLSNLNLEIFLNLLDLKS